MGMLVSLVWRNIWRNRRRRRPSDRPLHARRCEAGGGTTAELDVTLQALVTGGRAGTEFGDRGQIVAVEGSYSF